MTSHPHGQARPAQPGCLQAGATPVFRVTGLDTPLGELWIKNDGLTSPLYGGNKVRKLELILTHAVERGARRIVTVGAAGSHHVLATTVFGNARGLEVSAVLCPQRASNHARQTLADALALGLDARAVGSAAGIPRELLRLLRPGDYFVPPGGSNRLGTLGYQAALRELTAQIRMAELPEPDLIVVAVGSGGTAAGLLAGAHAESIFTRILGVRVGGYAPLTRPLVVSLAASALGATAGMLGLRALNRRLILEHGYLGRGYGWPSREAELGLEAAAAIGLRLDLTYTAKAFAKALELVGFPALYDFRSGCGLRHNRAPALTGRPLRVLYWHTLSAARPAPLVSRRESSSDVPKALAELFIRGER